jgi:hypothetical protein
LSAALWPEFTRQAALGPEFTRQAALGPEFTRQAARKVHPPKIANGHEPGRRAQARRRVAVWGKSLVPFKQSENDRKIQQKTFSLTKI